MTSLHAGGSPAAMMQEIYRNCPVGSQVELVEQILEHGFAAGDGGFVSASDVQAVIVPVLRRELRVRSQLF